MTVKELQNLGYSILKNKVPRPALETDLLLSYALNKERAFLYSHPDKKSSKIQTSNFKKFITRRIKGEPLAYIIGEAEFYGHKFKVTPDVLIPRPETEMLVEEAVKRIRNNELGIRNVIDVGTGSGAIIISIANGIRNNELGIRNLIGVDISEKALKVARANSKNLGVQKKVTFLRSNLLSKLPKNLKHPILLIANLPYLTSKEMKRAELKFEPKLALYGGRRGLELIEKLTGQFCKITKPGDVMLLEIGAKQGPQIKKLIKRYLPNANLEIKKDFNEFDRILIIKV